MARIRSLADETTFPLRVLEDRQTALVLFCAGFYGVQDAVFVADAGLQAVCVDVDVERVDVMRRIYPSGWDFVVDNVYEYAADTRLSPRDVVTVDCPSGHFDRCADMVERWCELATEAVVLGSGFATVVLAPTGWSVTETIKRTDYRGGVFWTVLEPA